MYQPLIWPAGLRNEARRLGTAFNAERVESLTNALVDRVRRDIELGRDLL
jgi:hypothetical protein